MGVIRKKPYEISIWEDRLKTVEIPETVKFTILANDTYTYTLPKEAVANSINIQPAEAEYIEEESTHTYTFTNNDNEPLKVSIAFNKNKSYYEEVKIAVIGSDRMTHPNRAFDPVLTENVNGEKTLTFSIAYRYYDPLVEDIVSNPFIPYLINERKIKLFYNNEWFEFLIKECDEASENYIFKYTARELFSLELSKVGYNITLDQSLNNNQGTAIELGKKVLEGTDWQVDEVNSDLLQQYIQEPMYICKVTDTTTITVLDLDTNQDKPLSLTDKTPIYIFYSYINNKQVSNVQFIWEGDKNSFEITDDHVIKSTNYRFKNDVTYIYTNNTITGFTVDGTTFNIESLNYSNQGYRLVYGPLTTYDPVMDRTVEIYKAEYDDGAREIYHYTDYSYVTSDVVTSYMANGSSFNVYDNGTLQGWSNTTPVSEKDGRCVLQPISLTTRPEVSQTSPFKMIDKLSTIEGYLKMKFNGVLTNNYENTYFNEGFEYNTSFIDHISKGEKFALRLRALTGDEETQEVLDKYIPIPQNENENKGIRAIVATYTTEKQEVYLDQDATQKSTIQSNIINPNEIVLDFNGNFSISPNIISNGVINSNGGYEIDSVVQTPSTLYIYKDKNSGIEYVWNPSSRTYVQKQNADFFSDYYITTATAQLSYSNEKLADPTFHLGVFIYTKDTDLIDKWVFIQDIQLTRYYTTTDENGNVQPVVIGNVPTAVSNATDYYYLAPDKETQKNAITTFGTLNSLADELGISIEKIQQVYNTDCEKILSIQASQSNCFNILQDICETFECWLKINVSHDNQGKIKLDKNKNPIKKIAFKKYCGKENFSGFKNGINLTGIERQIDSNEIVTKLIVEPVQSEFSDTGSIDIRNAKSNPSGEANIINLSYYLNRGLITDIDACNEDVLGFYTNLKAKNDKINELSTQNSQAQIALTKIASKRTTYTALIDEANKNYNQAIQDFYKLVKLTYEEYVVQAENGEVSEETETKVRSDSVLKVVSDIYVSYTAMNDYAGILTNLDKEYNDLNLLCNGAQIYDVAISFTPEITGGQETINPSTKVTFSDYVSGFGFELKNEQDGSVVYDTSPNDKIFTISAPAPYTKIKFIKLLNGYGLRYFKNNVGYDLFDTNATSTSFDITTALADEAYNIHFQLIPNPDYAAQHISYQEQIDKLIEEKSAIEKEFYKKYSRFLEEGTWSSQNYIDPELYYLDALQVSDTSAEPKVSYTINVLEVSQLENLQNYDFRVGDKTYIEDTDFFGYLVQAIQISTESSEELPNDEVLTTENTNNYKQLYAPKIGVVKTPVKEEVIVSEIEWHLDEPDNNTITVQNYKTRFEDLFQRISATVQTVQRNENTYPKTTSILNNDGLISSSLLADSLSGMGGQGFLLTSNGSVASTKDGLVIKDLSNSANVMRLMSRGIEVSNDGGQNWNTAISADGISTDLLTAGTINTQNIWIMDGDNPTFRWDKAGLSAYGLDGNGNFNYNLKTYVRFDKFGLYGIKDGETYVASSLEDVKKKAHFGVTWDGFFIKNSYANGRVEITSDDDFRVVTTDANNNDHERIKIGAIVKDSSGAPIKYGINIRNNDGDVVFNTGDDGNLTMTGTINALAGNFAGRVNVGDQNNTYIIIDGQNDNPTISSSNFKSGAGGGWSIDSNGDATFTNVSVRGSIKTAVFEYAEIQAVGGAFLFRPSSTIKAARVVETENEVDDLYLTVEKPLLFKKDNWVKISNYTGETPSIDSTGLVHIYKVSEITTFDFDDDDEELVNDSISEPNNFESIVEDSSDEEEFVPPLDEIVLEGGAAILETVALDDLVGGALIDFGNHATKPDGQGGTIDVSGTENYGIGINSSDNYVNLPARAISLFETTIHPNSTAKVTYNYRGILGTLPTMSDSGDDAQVASFYNQNMAGTQGIYTDNMYIGDDSQYVAFYEDENHQKQLKIKANQIVYEIDEQGKETTWEEHINEQIPIRVEIESSAGNMFLRENITTTLTCTVYKGNDNITSQVSKFTWIKYDKDGIEDETWVAPIPSGRSITIGPADVASKAIFKCEVKF